MTESSVGQGEQANGHSDREVTTYFKQSVGDPGDKHPRGCPCRPCMGRRNRRGGLRKQREARKALGVPNARNASQLSNEENWRATFRVEVKSGSQVGPVATRFLLAEQQSDANKSTGDPRPFLFVAMPKGWGSEGLVVLRLSEWRKHVGSIAED